MYIEDVVAGAFTQTMDWLIRLDKVAAVRKAARLAWIGLRELWNGVVIIAGYTALILIAAVVLLRHFGFSIGCLP